MTLPGPKVENLEEIFAETDLSTRAIHIDTQLSQTSDVAPPMSVSTTYRYPHIGDLLEGAMPDSIYSRLGQPTNYRTELTLGAITKAHAVTYSSGLASAFAAFVHYNPKRIAIRNGYHGTHGSIAAYKRSNNVEVLDIDAELQKGDLLWVESPLNPTGETVDIKHYAERARAAGATLVVDSTFGPPPLQNPFDYGADAVMHSGTKYFGGHSDLLAGVLLFKTKEEADKVRNDRTYLGSNIGNMEAWLLLRSVRTLKVRVLQQSKTATELVAWLAGASDGKEFDGIPAGTVAMVKHASVQDKPNSGWNPRSANSKDTTVFDPKSQMPGGFGAVFCLLLATPILARNLPEQLHFFHHATSLGGVESLIEYRNIWVPEMDKRLLRVSIGLEDIEDLKADFRRAFKKVHEMVANGTAA